ncbi:TetR/AcrR family transcriptional regulator [Mycobacterium sp. URHB0044]|uniref:TetR/AcrR family transcriptional regulator n=1 Tax=Mycobacterium sp. URHB0044 TaxID=1380386 RepID=UPI00055AB9B9|nr:TetR/AcrR family transcriptional regulator [Mycobacterium sp. URHB0044]
MAERADAARNRQAVLEAAGRLFDDGADPGTVSMDDVARAAGVGKGTLFRRFGDRTTLLHAVYDARLADLRTELESGSAPLGPDAAPAERIPAILDAIVTFKLNNRRLALALEQSRSGETSTLYDAPHYVETHQLLARLLTAVVKPGDASWTAHVLLAATRIDLVDHLVTSEKVSRRRLRTDLRRLVERLLT